MAKSQIFFTLFFGIVLKSTWVFSFSLPEDCKYQVTHRSNLQFSQRYQKDIAECWFSIQPMNGYVDLKYRSYLVTSSGMLLVFNSFGAGSNEKTTGARQYFFFPRETFVAGGISLSDDVLLVRVNSKLTLQFETKNLYPLNTENISIKNDTLISPKNAGGVEVLRYNGVYLDTGFMMGNSPNQIQTVKSMFKNQFGEKCSVLNSVIFDYKKSDPTLLHDVLLKKIVAAQCPSFRWED